MSLPHPLPSLDFPIFASSLFLSFPQFFFNSASRLCYPKQLSVLQYMHPNHLQKSSVFVVQTPCICHCLPASGTPSCCGDYVQIVSGSY